LYETWGSQGSKDANVSLLDSNAVWT
jgi:hypothetical protein